MATAKKTTTKSKDTNKSTKTVAAKTSKTSTKSIAARRSSRKETPAVKETKITKSESTVSLKDQALLQVNRLKEVKNRVPRKIFWGVVVAVGLVLLGWLASKYLIVAWVDGQPITRIELLGELEKRYGKDTREQLVIQKLIANEAKNRGTNVSDAEINTEIKRIEQEQGGADKLQQVLQMQGIKESEFKELVRLQLLRQKMFGANANVTDKEVNDYIEQNKAQLPEKIDDALKSRIKEEIKQQKIAADYNAWLQEALNGTRVKRI